MLTDFWQWSNYIFYVTKATKIQFHKIFQLLLIGALPSRRHWLKSEFTPSWQVEYDYYYYNSFNKNG